MHHTHSTQETALQPPTPILNEQTPNTIRGHILFAFGVILTLALAWRLREVLLLIYVSALFAVVLMPVVRGIMLYEMRGGRHVSRVLAIALLLGSVFLLLAGFLLVGLPPVIHDIHQFATEMPARIPSIVAKLKRLPMADKLGVDSITQKAESALSTTAEYLFVSFPNWIGRIADLLTAIILCVYFMLEGDHAYQWFMSLFSVEQRLRLAVTLEKAEIRMSRWLFGQGLLMLILGVCSTLVFGLLHIRYFFLLGVLMGLMNIIPIAGGVITIAIVGAVAATESWSKMSGVFLFYLIYVNVENAYLTPRIMRSSVDLLGLAVLVALIVGVALAGLVGALVAVPTAALIAVLMDEYLVQEKYVPPDNESEQPTITN